MERPAEALQPQQRQHARARLISEFDSVVPGTTAWLGLNFEIDDGWHLYWNGLNDTGFPIQAEVAAPDGYRVGNIVWPAPVRHTSPGDLLDHVYEKRVTLLIPIEIPGAAEPGTKVRVSVDANWLVCQEACLPGSALVRIELPVAAAGTKPIKSRDAAAIDEARSLVPKTWASDNKMVTIAWEGDALGIRSSGSKDVAFYPGEKSAAVADLVTSGVAKDGRLTLLLAKAGPGARLTGVVEVGRPGKGPRTLYWIDFPAETGNRVPDGPSH